MSYASRKGYGAEAAIVKLLTQCGFTVTRPRTTSHRDTDTGDVRGLPLVISVKNHARIKLAECCDELRAMVERSPWDTGVLIHKRIGRGQPEDWYATMQVRHLMYLIVALEAVARLREQPSQHAYQSTARESHCDDE